MIRLKSLKLTLIFNPLIFWVISLKLEELKKILDKMIDEAKWGFEENKWYKPLIELEVIKDKEFPQILDDSYYDAQAVAFARNILDLIDEL